MDQSAQDGKRYVWLVTDCIGHLPTIHRYELVRVTPRTVVVRQNGGHVRVKTESPYTTLQSAVDEWRRLVERRVRRAREALATAETAFADGPRVREVEGDRPAYMDMPLKLD